MSGGDTADAATEEFVAALRTAQAALREVPGMLEAARVHDFAFGRLFEATEVRDAYHSRLPETEKDIGEACEVVDHFIAGLAGGHAIDARRGASAGPGGSGGRDGADGLAGLAGPAARTVEWTADTFPWCRVLPEQAGSVEP
ncbi:MAG: hypothetical protein HOV83_31150 [Catenulispora sp.]|nr:hypothetical protein [Catenulispora sp.]